MFPKDVTIHYAYKMGQGLISRRNKNATGGHAILPDLLALKFDKPMAVKSFIEKHGYLFPLDKENDNSIDEESLFALINRLKASVSLMNVLIADKIDYRQMFALTMYLLLTQQTSIKYFGGEYHTWKSDIGYYWNNLSSVDIHDPNDERGLLISDYIRPEDELFFLEFDIGNSDGIEDYRSMTFKAIVLYLFKHINHTQPESREAIDFLYHFFKDVGVPESWDYTGELTFLDRDISKSTNFYDGFDTQRKERLTKLARWTLKSEIDFNIKTITPSYDIDSMTPSWHVNTLMAGLYYSLFYMHPNIEQYRYCANPNCGMAFLVMVTSHNKMYCSKRCGNAMQQRKLRRRRMESIKD